ncbi:MAG: glycosyltransferase family 2 protein [Candidatus Brocadiaceae bacterium]|nr:glycosyltransferase family 2 protein [Candidatus Brocadiaceae bacterium]
MYGTFLIISLISFSLVANNMMNALHNLDNTAKPPLISITMSAYNVESYINECLDCIVNQTLRDIEIICVNDGSTDRTLSILQEYALRDSRIKIIDKSINGGLAAARNEAIAIASGKYIGFVDGDDMLDRDLFRKAYECAEENQSDLVLWDYAVFWDICELNKKLKKPSHLASISADDKIALLKRPAFAWTKLIRSDVVKSLEIFFPINLSRQDIPVHWKLVTQLDNIAILPKRLSFYRQQELATTHRTDWKLADLAIVMDLVRDYLLDNNMYDTYKDEFLQQQLGRLCGMTDSMDRHLKQQAMQMVYDRLGDDQWQYINDNKQLRWQTRDFYLAIRGSLIAKARRIIWLLSRSCYRFLKSA